ncbi:TetR/AcrR family transcriptional regulator [Brevundimonas albigilva]|uniref:TetR/AcrR family transcriptional regulator n=1 Tax=Brevundimonas albigilva TaxID=1312364 RepID=UPI0032215203
MDEDGILRAARATFVALGASATTRDVADAAGVSQALLFQRWQTKERLFFAAMLPRPPSLDLVFDRRDGENGAQGRLVGVASRLLAWLETSMPGALRAALHPSYPAAIAKAHAPEGAEALHQALTKVLRDLRSDGLLTGSTDLQASAAALLDLLHGIALRRALTGVSTLIEQEADRAVSAMLRGLEPT